jgi:hypothetical protein
MNTLRYIWANKVLTAVALLAILFAVHMFRENYHIAIVSKQSWVNYQLSASTYCDANCQADVLTGLMEQGNY